MVFLIDLETAFRAFPPAHWTLPSAPLHFGATLGTVHIFHLLLLNILLFAQLRPVYGEGYISNRKNNKTIFASL